MPGQSLEPLPLPEGIEEDYVDCSSSVGLVFHTLEARAGAESKTDLPLVLLLHGFPELAFSWRKVMPKLAAAGNRVVAVDQRGYGRTTGWEHTAQSFEDSDLREFSNFTLVRDLVALVDALGHSHVTAVIGHDFGAVSAASCAVMRPDLFQSCILMSHPFKGPLSIAAFSSQQLPAGQGQPDVHEALAALPKPRKHYKWYNSTPPAASHWQNPPQGLPAFLRGYIHLKSATWAQNEPHKLFSWTAEELAKMPTYYIMPLNLSMPETVAEAMKDEDMSATKTWLPDADLNVYVREWTRTGFQGGLNWYRSGHDLTNSRDLLLFSGKKIEVPTAFISGEQDWGNYQEPGALEGMPHVCSDFRGVRMVKGAGHWPQQEQPDAVVDQVLKFLEETR